MKKKLIIFNTAHQHNKTQLTRCFLIMMRYFTWVVVISYHTVFFPTMLFFWLSISTISIFFISGTNNVEEITSNNNTKNRGDLTMLLLKVALHHIIHMHTFRKTITIEWKTSVKVKHFEIEIDLFSVLHSISICFHMYSCFSVTYQYPNTIQALHLKECSCN